MIKIIAHCSDSSFGNAAILTKWHVLPKPNGRGWSNIGYHKVILNGWLSSKAYNKDFDGYIETGRPLDDDNLIEPFEFGAHTKGHNFDSVGICLIGKSGKFTEKQIISLKKEIQYFKELFGTIEVGQHSDYDKNKPYCAGLDFEKLNI